MFGRSQPSKGAVTIAQPGPRRYFNVVYDTCLHVTWSLISCHMGVTTYKCSCIGLLQDIA
jgi:hypothetical protein